MLYVCVRKWRFEYNPRRNQFSASFTKDIIMFAFKTLFPTLILVSVIFIHGQNSARAEIIHQTGATVCPRIVSRLAWGAEEPRSTINFPNLPEFVVICHTVTDECLDIATCSTKIRAMQRDHMDERHWDDISYNFLIGEDGAVYEGRGWDHVGSHSMSYNTRSIGISFIGNFREILPDPIALNAAKELIKCGVSEGKIPREYKLVGHRQVKSTISPGEILFNEIKTWPRWTPNLTKK